MDRTQSQGRKIMKTLIKIQINTRKSSRTPIKYVNEPNKRVTTCGRIMAPQRFPGPVSGLFYVCD